MELNVEEQTLLATYRSLEDHGKKELLRFAAQQRGHEVAAGLTFATGQCKLHRGEERPEIITEPIFTE